MIQLPDDMSEHASAASWRLAVRTFFAPGGVLARAKMRSRFPFEERPQQRQMAEAVATALASGRHLMVEAGTGVGKSFAYLVPLILACVRQRQRGFVATWTISLQEQLVRRDLPFLREHLGVEFSWALGIGRGNYLCLRRLKYADANAPKLLPEADHVWLRWLGEWVKEAEEGTLQEMPRQPPLPVWENVCSEQDACRGSRCAHAAQCFYRRAKRQLAHADLIIVNHHLLMTHLARPEAGLSLIPEATAIVLDEAHQLEDVASEHFGLRLSRSAFDRLYRRLFTDERNRVCGWLVQLQAADLIRRVQQSTEETNRLFTELEQRLAQKGELGPWRVREPPGITTQLPEQLAQLGAGLARLRRQHHDQDVRSELGYLAARADALARMLQAFLTQSESDHVYWIEREGRLERLVLHSAPIDVGPTLRVALFQRVRSAILTSATLAVDGSFDYLRGRLGVPDCDTLVLGSPFDFGRQMKLFIPSRMPPPTSPEFPAAAARAVGWLTVRNGGGTLVLCTNANFLRDLVAATKTMFEKENLTVLAQGGDRSRHQLLEQFRGGERMVLFGLDSFWMGVDVPGNALSQVIITRLPFAVPDEPIIEARIDQIRQRGGDPFREYSLPMAVIKFRQGVGRLIRTAEDCGVVVVLDRRIIERWYGPTFLAAIPKCQIEEIEIHGTGSDFTSA